VSLISELQRRNVLRVAVAYVVAAWLLAQAVELATDAFEAPGWVLKMVMSLLALGLVPALIFSWIYEMTPEGIKKESEIAPDQSATAHTAKKLDLAVIVLLVAAIGLFAADRFLSGNAGGETAPTETSDVAAGAAPTVSPTSDIVSVAVLPFTNMSADADNEYFADGISEEILNLLAGVRDLEVASRTSAFVFKGADTPIPEIARQLNVRYVLEGSVRKAGQQVRITAQLIDANNDRHLWSETYDRTLDDIFAIQDEIAGAIGAALQVELLGVGGDAVSAEAIDAQVYDHFLEARALLRRRNESDQRRATELLEQVVAAEPGFARGHVVLGEAYLLSNYLDDEAFQLARARARIEAEAARQLDPDLGGIYLILGSFAQSDGNLAEALDHFGRAIELEPDEPRPYHWRGMLYGAAGRIDLAYQDAQRALELDPNNANVHGWYSAVLVTMGEFEHGFEQAQISADLGNPIGGYMSRALWTLMTGDAEMARTYFAEAFAGDEERTAWGALVLAAATDPAAGPALRAAIDAGRFPGQFALRGSLLALGYEEELLEHYAGEGRDRLDLFLAPVWGERMRAMRQDPRFIAHLESNGVAAVWTVIGPPQDCRAEGAAYSCGFGYPNGYLRDGNRQ
jgi:adenylate cyclase